MSMRIWLIVMAAVVAAGVVVVEAAVVAVDGLFVGGIVIDVAQSTATNALTQHM